MGERASSRVEVDRLIDFQIGDRAVRALLYNLSVGGCMIEGPDDRARPGDEVSRHLDDLVKVTGRVIWQCGQYCGIRFEANIPEEIVAQLGFKPPEEVAKFDWPVDGIGRVLLPLRG